MGNRLIRLLVLMFAAGFLLPAGAQILQCGGFFYCQSWGYYNPATNTISGGSILCSGGSPIGLLGIDDYVLDPWVRWYYVSSSPASSGCAIDYFWYQPWQMITGYWGVGSANYFCLGGWWEWWFVGYSDTYQFWLATVPTGEENELYDRTGPLRERFRVHILPADLSFAGRYVTEDVYLTDGCWFFHSPVDQIPDYYDNSGTTVSAGNLYEDLIGLGNTQARMDWANYYGLLLGWNCSWSGMQSMSMDYVGSYEWHSVGVFLDGGPHAYVCRKDTCLPVDLPVSVW